MKTKQLYLMITLALLASAVAACGPSPEEMATMTAAAWTDTPTPTLTPSPTPIPIDLSLQVQDGDGNAIAGALVVFNELEEVQSSDAGGQVELMAIPSNHISMSVSAPGYFPAEQDADLVNGPNEVTVALERDPYGLLASEACHPSEDLLYIEDFQAGTAEGWPQIDFFTLGWGVGDAPEEEGNLAAYNETPETHPGALYDDEFDQIVWRFDFKKTGSAMISFNMLQKNDFTDENDQFINDSRYMNLYMDSEAVFNTRRIYQPILGIDVDGARFRMQDNQWYHLEISRFDGQVQVWVDGTQILAYEDRQPLGPGQIGFEIFEETSPGTVVYFDNISVCGLSAEFEALPAAEEEPES